jgi:hypothetical protein
MILDKTVLVRHFREHRGYPLVGRRRILAGMGEKGTYEFVRRLVFPVLIGSGNMHLKNWSLLYFDGRRPVLSAAYEDSCGDRQRDW